VVRFKELDDATLLASTLKGDRSAYAVLVERYNQGAYVVAYRYVGDRGEAEDIVQTAFMKLWERPGMWNPDMDSRFSAWFYRMVINLCLDWCKKKKPLLYDGDIIKQASKENQEEEYLLIERQTLLEKQIDALPTRQRIAINLSYSCGLSNKEAAEVMDISLRALQSLIMRAKSTIRLNLEKIL
jgi:RNA polymerase sigma-70 factor (ECF subfamily)